LDGVKGSIMEDLIKKARVLFLCTGNSCRSQMAEGIVNHFLTDQWQAFSAGTTPAGFVHPLAIKALAEIGIQHQGVSKPVNTFLKDPFDMVITVCDGAAEACPVWPGMGQRVHMGFPDPALARGSEKEQMVVFRQVRDTIKAQVLPFLDKKNKA
jgi:arsenate reductase (thioredoxin)